MERSSQLSEASGGRLRDAEPPLAAPTAVLHLVGRLTDAVFSFLGPATAALAERGARQTVVLVDDPLHRHLLPKFHESVRLVLTSASGSRLEQASGLLDAFCSAAKAGTPAAAHLHGMTPLLIGLYASCFRGFPAKMHFSPHGSRLMAPLRALGLPLLRIVELLAARLQPTIASSRVDARALGDGTEHAVALVESPVAETFFATALTPSPSPLMVTCSRLSNPLGAAVVAQSAVLLAGLAPGLHFSWIGRTEGESLARLKAAGVSMRDISGDSGRAARMASAWVYIEPPGGHGFPVFLIEAMALGLPCVAWDTPYHRDILRQGDTGFLCSTTAEATERIAELIESPALRQQLGGNARREARSRFDADRFRESLLGLYDVTTPS